MSRPAIERFARDLGEAWANADTVPAPTATDPNLSIDDAYAIQEAIIAQRLNGGRSRVGWKLGLTSAGPETTPIVGTLLSDMVVPPGTTLPLSSLVAPMVEAELVIRIGEKIAQPQTVAMLRAGPHQVGPGLEVIDYRTTDSTGPIDWVADNSTVAYAVVGDLVPISDVEAADIGVALYGDGSHLADGSGASVMGDPLAAVAWLTGHLSERGHTLAEGHVILTGSLTGHHPVPAGTGSGFMAEFDRLGSVSVAFLP